MTTWVKITSTDQGRFPYVFVVAERQFQLQGAPGSRKWELVEYRTDGTVYTLKTWNSNKVLTDMIADAFLHVLRRTSPVNSDDVAQLYSVPQACPVRKQQP